MVGGTRTKYVGATLDFVVADECPQTPNNQPCIADGNHLDLSRKALVEFQKNGQSMPLNNDVIWQRQVFWKFLD